MLTKLHSIGFFDNDKSSFCSRNVPLAVFWSQIAFFDLKAREDFAFLKCEIMITSLSRKTIQNASNIFCKIQPETPIQIPTCRDVLEADGREKNQEENRGKQMKLEEEPWGGGESNAWE